MACPWIRASVTSAGSGSPGEAQLQRDEVEALTSSVTGCSTCSRVLTSRNQNAPVASMTNSTVPAPV